MIKIYSADWCPDTKAIKKYLETLRIPYEYFNAEEDPEAAKIINEKNDQKKAEIPVIIIGEDVLINPEIKVLNKVLNKHNLL